MRREGAFVVRRVSARLILEKHISSLAVISSLVAGNTKRGWVRVSFEERKKGKQTVVLEVRWGSV